MTFNSKNLFIILLLSISASFFSFEFNNKNYIQADELTIEVTQKQPTASNQNDGIIKVTVVGGIAPYKLVVHTSTRSKPIEISGLEFELKDLNKGFYLINITDAKGNFVSKTINL